MVAEGAEKPEAALEFDEVDEPVKKIASFLPVSDEMLSDTPAIQGYLNARLSLFVRTEEELQFLHGAGKTSTSWGCSPGSRSPIGTSPRMRRRPTQRTTSSRR